MENINLDTWERKEHFEFFLKSDLPLYNINFAIDITGLKEKTTENKISINNALIYFTVKTLNQINNFLYRFENGAIVKYDKIDPSFACLRNGEELFRLITIEYDDDLFKFDEISKKAIAESKAYFDLQMLSNRSNFVFISTLPWIPFTGIDHTQNLRKEDAIPRVSWGKFYGYNNKIMLPYNIQVNHIFIDGIHVGKFYELFQEEIYKYLGRPSTGSS